MNFLFEEQLINYTENSRLWQENSQYFYDIVIQQKIGRALSTQWFDKSGSTQKIIVGEDRSENGRYLSIYETDFNEDQIFELEGNKRFRTYFEIKFDSEVHRIRIRPDNPLIIACILDTGEAKIINILNPSQLDQEGYSMTSLKGHTEEGYGINWNHTKKGLLATCAYDKKILIWDTNLYGNELEPISSYNDHSAGVEDVEWNPHDPNSFGSVADDQTLKIFDTRTKTHTLNIIAHKEEVNSLSFSPFYPNLIVTGSSDKCVALWDIRNTSTRLHSLLQHQDKIFQVSFSPNDPNLIASSGDDKKILIWDTSQIGDEQQGRDADIGPPELIFTHSGNLQVIREFDWHPTIPYCFTSVDDNHINLVWKLKPNIIKDESEKDFFKILKQSFSEK
ncbi:wd40 repeat family [Anaeramoeba flamelloides]|uniref:Wd40 repeat family n=1 Tax=Anaeramoeba flamelloides TaxID=1746091 RepID=A0AAV7YN15_9EUKA|nr:wd40 repeat family [Anaeramoeba flamelloides]